MSSPGGIKIPPATQGTGLGDKTFGDLIENDVKLEIKGTNVKVTGSLKNVAEWTEFSQTDNSGHFLPIQLPASCQDKDVTVKGRKDGNRVIHPTADDMILVVRLENLSGTSFILEADGKTVLTVDVSGLKLRPYVGKDAIRLAEQTEDMDAVKPASLLIGTDVQIAWTGTSGKVTGSIKKYQMPENHFGGRNSHYLPVVIMGHDGEEITATGSDGQTTVKLTDPKWIIEVPNFQKTQNPAKLAVEGLTLCELDLTALTLNE